MQISPASCYCCLFGDGLRRKNKSDLSVFALLNFLRAGLVLCSSCVSYLACSTHGAADETGFHPMIQHQQGIQHKTLLCPSRGGGVTQGQVLGWFPSTSFGANLSAGWGSAWSCWVGCCQHLLGPSCSEFCSPPCLALVTAALLAQAQRALCSPETMSQKLHWISKVSQDSETSFHQLFLPNITLLHF